MKAFEIKNNIFWTGVIDADLKVFDIIMETEHGTTYNSYFINDEKKVLIDTVKANFKDEFIEKLSTLTDIKDIDYVIINHTEPDHSGSLKYILEINPNIEVFCTQAASIFLKEQVNKEFKCNIIKDGQILNIGSRNLKFITAPFLHWSDSMFVYSESDKVLFTCDGFGSHYSKVDPQSVNDPEYPEALKFYYDCIVRPFAQHVLNAIDKVKDLDIDIILTSHGPILSEDPMYNVKKYLEWSSEEVKNRNQRQVALIYLSAYHNTVLMAQKIKEGLESENVHVEFIDAESEDIAKIHNIINSSKGLILGSPTINRTMVKPMWDVLSVIDPMANMGKVAGVFGSFGWSGEGIQMANTILKQMGFKIPLEPISKKFSPSQETLDKCFEFGKNFAKHI
ncbi:Flavorubredoxin [Alkalithermobacter thermoalcaliphilus JW-YL-7 = DSM 7308]|uniref:Beta-lactamase domain protein n=1 Tax=Alkalithermobacter thermoalcaliphilus JW-YL-7 = DSM 7308 TaxID=1121328 RepID=A0A150FRB2_CLOPD|nr:beta-lactamase domain protein [[Clostridium] paradoxum JW-YL-7 = DSM 7308]SHL38670.1 Flavorubredoxin [[Clostridium] paradoxum JW-YL-7 = DSM 7308]